VYGVLENCDGEGTCNVSMVSIDRQAGSIKTLFPAERLGAVTHTYYAWNKSHYAVITDSPPTLTFYDTLTVSIPLRNAIQANVTVRSLAINYVTRNVVVLAVYGGALKLMILHMTGVLQEVLVPDLSKYHADHVGPSCIDNVANVMYSILRTSDTCYLVSFNLANHGSVIDTLLIPKATVDAMTMDIMQ